MNMASRKDFMASSERMAALEAAYHSNVLSKGSPDFADLDEKFGFWVAPREGQDVKDNKGWHSFTILKEKGVHVVGRPYQKASPAPVPEPAKDKMTTREHPKFRRMLYWVETSTPVMLIGPAGSGKTTAAQLLAKELGISFLPQSFCNQTPESRFAGFVAAGGNYVPSGFYDVFKNGGVYLLDEMDAANPNVLVAFNAAVANGYWTFPNGETVKAHGSFRAVAAANTWGKGADRAYQGRNALDAATLDRFAKLAWDYDEAHELHISPRADWTKHVQKVRRACQTLSIQTVISPRASINGGKALNAGKLTWAEVEEDTIFSGMDCETLQKVKAAIR